MPHCFGLRARTRDLFSKPYKKHGVIPLSKYMVQYKMGDIVDVIADGSVQRGMPHKYYHGKTGRVFDVTKTSVGVMVNKVVRGRVLKKKIHIRVEHVRQSQSREAFKERVRKNDALKRAAKVKGEKVNTKRIPEQPKEQKVIDVSKTSVEYMNPIKYRDLF